MDPGGSELDSSLPQADSPCLIVEDSQPDSVALEDDPETSYRALLARRLSSLQPTSRSPVLELISSPLGSRYSQSDSQSESSQSNNQAEPGVVMEADPSSAIEEESPALFVCPPNKNKCVPEDGDVDPGADSTTHCVQSEGEPSQFDFLELSQSQDQRGEAANSRQEEEEEEEEEPQPGSEGRTRLAGQNFSLRSSESQDNKALRSSVLDSAPLVSSRSEVSSSSSSARPLGIQALLHSEGPQASGEQDGEGPSSQDDMFDADKTGAAVDSTVSEPEQPGRPAQSLGLLQLSGRAALVQESLSQDYVSPTPDPFPHTPLIIPSSPTDPDAEHGADEPMDTSLPPEDRAGGKGEEPMDTEAASKPHPSASTPVSQNAPGFALERTLSLPSQPEFSHDAFAPTQSQEAAPRPDTKTSAAPSASFALPPLLSSELEEDDSQATQIEELGGAAESNGVPPEPATPSGAKAAVQPAKPRGADDSCEAARKSDVPKKTSPDAERVDAEDGAVSCSQTKLDSSTCVQETPPHAEATPLLGFPSPPPSAAKCSVDSGEGGGSAKGPEVKSLPQERGASGNSQAAKKQKRGDEEEEEEGSGMALVLSHSHMLFHEPMEEEEEGGADDSVVVVTDSERDARASAGSTNRPTGGNAPVSTNGHEPRAQAKRGHAAPDRLSQPERAGPEPEGLRDKSLSDSSGEISFHFTLPKEGDLIGPVVGATPPLINQLKQTLRHSTPIEISSFSEKSGVACDAAMAAMTASDIASGESGDDATEKEGGKLSLRMKLVTPVEEGSSERFSLQKPALSEEDGSVAKVTAVAKAVTSPSVFSRVRQAHRQQEAREELQAAGNTTPVRGPLPSSPQRSSPASSLGCSSLPNSQSEPSHQEAPAAPQETTRKAPPGPAEDGRALETPAQSRTEARPRDGTVTSSPSNKLRQRTVSQQTSFDGRGEPESPSCRRAAGPAHRRHVRTVQEVRTTVTRVITDVYYEDGKEVERKVTEESEEPVVDCQVLDGDVSPCRTGNSSVTSGDLADISSLSSKASSLQHSSGGTSSSGFARPDFIMPPIRGAFSPRRGGGQQQRGQRGHRAGSAVTLDRGLGPPGLQALGPTTPRGRARRGRPRSRFSTSRGVGSPRPLDARGPPPSSSEDEPFSRMLPPRLPADGELRPPLRSSPEEANSAGGSFVGLRVVAKWSSNGYFYSGCIVGDAGEGSYRLRFDDGYECEVAGRDILLCDPIPMETEVTALLEDEYFSIGVVRGHKTEGQELLYSVEKDGEQQWYNRTAIILSLEQGNKLREQHSLGPYEPRPPVPKASDISLDNLVEGKRRRRGAPEGPATPDRSPRTPGPSGKRKLMASDNTRTPAKRGRRGAGARAAAQRPGLVNTSGSGTDLAVRPGAVAETHGPPPQNPTLFMGFAFMLTTSSEIDRLANRHGSDDEDDDDAVQTGPYNKAYTESQLQAGGGFVLQDFNEEQCKAAYQSLLIADQHCRTRKYLLCLASGVPSVSHIWVRDCCRDNKLLNYRNYLLPAGVGPDDAIVEWHPRSSPFKALRVLLVFEQPVELWVQLVALGGGSPVRQFPTDKDASDVPAGRFDVVVTDRSCPAALEKAVTSQEVPLVSPEWLIQSVIRGERLGFTGKPQYRHDFSSSSSS
ncbi:TP53-binding protein 1 isoform X3 [Pseudoliparis swirei]|uniref:TP53-binding protein 1 isoform X3 n=1 Tax=Pseudoliparis swirei TaxID=2059687 RepID=UPI0024BE28D4|nr:TP53-binding protein 1 isoform X3 [Pseudoliparis swirei]